MDTGAFASAHRAFEKAAREADYEATPETGWSPRLVVGHVIATDRLLMETAARLHHGLPARYDGEFLDTVPYLEAIVAGLITPDDFEAAARRAREELLAVARTLDERSSFVLIPTKIVDGGRVLVDEPMPFVALLKASAAVHLPAHTAQVAGVPYSLPSAAGQPA